jgi:hypothetical protein
VNGFFVNNFFVEKKIVDNTGWALSKFYVMPKT